MAVGRTILGHGTQEIDARGCLLTPGFVDAHTHLDKSLLHEAQGKPAADLRDMIVKMREIKRRGTVEGVSDRITRGIRLGVAHGTTAMRTNVEVDPFFRFKGVRAVEQSKSETSRVMSLQTIAFPQDGWFRTSGGFEVGCERYVDRALAMGLDIVGGNVNAALWPSDARQQVDRIFALAKRHDKPIDAHVDNADNSVAFTLPYVAEKTIREGYQGRVTVGHIASLAKVPDQVAARTIRLMKDADIHVGVCPTRIALTRVRELLESGVNVFIGTDGIMSIYSRSGTADMLMAMWLLALLTRLCGDADYEEILKMATYNGARAMGLGNYGLGKGKTADLVLLEAKNATEAIGFQARRLLVLKHGRIVARDGVCLDDEARPPGTPARVGAKRDGRQRPRQS